MTSHLYSMTPEQKRLVNEALSDLNRAIDTISRLEKCGTNCQSHRAEVERLIGQLEAFRAQFGSTAG